jgi:hypothetical protein
MGDAGCEQVVRSGILKRLQVLDLQFCGITDRGARILAESPDIHHLRHLDLEDNWLTAEGIALLESRGIPARVGQQRMEEEGYPAGTIPPPQWDAGDFPF